MKKILLAAILILQVSANSFSQTNCNSIQFSNVLASCTTVPGTGAQAYVYFPNFTNNSGFNINNFVVTTSQATILSGGAQGPFGTGAINTGVGLIFQNPAPMPTYFNFTFNLSNNTQCVVPVAIDYPTCPGTPPAQDTCCINSQFGNCKWGATPQSLQTLVPNSTITAAPNSYIFVKLPFNCNAQCNYPKVDVAFFNASNQQISVSPVLPSGQFYIPANTAYFKVNGYCSGSPCQSFRINVASPATCVNAAWSYANVIATYPVAPTAASQSFPSLPGSFPNCGTLGTFRKYAPGILSRLTINFHSPCAGNPNNYIMQIINSAGLVVAQSIQPSPSSWIRNLNFPAGNYKFRFQKICGGYVCLGGEYSFTIVP